MVSSEAGASSRPSASAPAVDGRNGQGAEPDRVLARGEAGRMIDSASQPGSGCRAPTRPAARGPWAGAAGAWPGSCLTSGRSAPGTSTQVGRAVDQPVQSAACDPVPNGPSPVAAKVSTAPRLKMSLAGPISAPRTCSGDMYPGEPIMQVAPVGMRSPRRPAEMPKSMTRGPSSASSTLEGFRSRCTTPAAWMALRPSASPAARVASVLRRAAGRGSLTASASEGPATYAVASHGTGPSRSASTTSAVNRPLTFWAAATSTPQRARKPGSSASSGRMTLTAIGRPPADMPRNTWPMPPLPS